MTSFIHNLIADRIGGTKFDQGASTYKFEKIKQAKRATLAIPSQYPYFIDMGIGEPDEMAPDFIIESLHSEAKKHENRGYADNGCIEFINAVIRYMKDTYNVELNTSEVLHTIGSKAGLSLLPYCFINPGDYTLMTSPGYPILGTHASYLGGQVYSIPLLKQNNYLPDLSAVPESILKKSKILVLNYPNNPTGASATLDFFKQAIEFAYKHQLLIVQDAAYAGLSFSPDNNISILQIDGAKGIAVELHSLSKAFNMTGWRIGWICGNQSAVKAYGMVKDNSDSGQFLAIQKASIQALTYPQFPQKMAQKYKRRLQKMHQILNNAGFDASMPQAGFFCFVPAPKAANISGHTLKFSSAEAASQWLIKEKWICCVPWDELEPSLRFSATFSIPPSVSEDAFFEEFQSRLSAETTYHF